MYLLVNLKIYEQLVGFIIGLLTTNQDKKKKEKKGKKDRKNDESYNARLDWILSLGWA